MQTHKHRKKIDSFHLIHIVSYLQNGGGGNKARTTLVRQKTTYISKTHPTGVVKRGPNPTSKSNTYDKQV